MRFWIKGLRVHCSSFCHFYEGQQANSALFKRFTVALTIHSPVAGPH